MKLKLFIIAGFSLCALTCLVSNKLSAQSETHNFITYDSTIIFPSGGWNVKITRPDSMFVAGHRDTASRPAIIFMVGAGEVGAGNFAGLSYHGPHFWLNSGWDGGITLGNGKHYPIIISVSPHFAWPSTRSAGDLLIFLLNTYHIKRNSVHITGLSMGAMTWGRVVTAERTLGDNTYMRLIKSFTALQGNGTSDGAPAYQMGGDLPVGTGFSGFGHWARQYGGKIFGLTGTKDYSGPGVWKMVEPMNDSLPGSGYHSYEIFGDGEHCCWNTMYDPGITDWTSVGQLPPYLTDCAWDGCHNSMGTYKTGDYVFKWMLKQGDTTLVGTNSLTANAGPDQTIHFPTTQVTLAGSGTANNGDSIISHVWTKISGASATITDPSNYGTTVTGLSSGIYVFRLTVEQGNGQTASDNVIITVHPPTANAGPDQTITLPTTQVTLAGSGTANNGGVIISHVWTKISSASATITDPSNYGTTVTGLSVGVYNFRLTVIQDDNQTASDTVTITVNGSGKTIAGKIEAENWDSKVGGMYAVGTNDTGGGQHVVGISNGSSMDYNVNVLESGTYTVNFRIATTQNNAQFQIKSGSTVLGTINIPNTGGWTTWQTASVNNISLTAGSQTIRIQSTNNESCNFNWMDWVLETSTPGKTIPGKIETENWDTKSGGMYAVTDTTGAGSGGQYVVGISNGSSMDYNVTVTQSGTYTVNFRIATTQNNAQFQIKSGSTVLGTINIPNTGGWTTWQTASVNNISLTAGPQTIRILSTNNESCNFNWTNWVLDASSRIAGNKPPVIVAPVPKETVNGLALSAFPNPANTSFNLKVQSKTMELVTIKVVDIAGRQVQQMQVVPGQAFRFGDNIVKGTYLVEVRQGSEKVVTKIVKQ